MGKLVVRAQAYRPVKPRDPRISQAPAVIFPWRHAKAFSDPALSPHQGTLIASRLSRPDIPLSAVTPPCVYAQRRASSDPALSPHQGTPSPPPLGVFRAPAAIFPWPHAQRGSPGSAQLPHQGMLPPLGVFRAPAVISLGRMRGGVPRIQPYRLVKTRYRLPVVPERLQ